jgi:phosphatidylserine/phosphatidylglycerophosphate/cardiolipin synthase-like enzyme
VKYVRTSLFLSSLQMLITSHALAKTDVLFSPNGGVRSRIIHEMSSAERRIDVAIYSFSDKSVQTALKHAAQNGIKVRLILDSARERAALADDMERSGIDVRYVLPVMHHKFAVIDGKDGVGALSNDATVITGSANWSNSSETEYDEDFLIFAGEQSKTQAFQAEFDHLWEYARDYPGSATSEGSELSLERTETVETLFTSANFSVARSGARWSFRPLVDAEHGVAGSAIVKAINEAQRTLQIATTHLRRRDMYNALQAAAARGVKVELLLDQQEFRGKPGADALESDIYYDELLANEGVDVRYKLYTVVWNAARAKQMHSKYMIVDGQLVLTGSFNWSGNSEVGTFENLNRIVGDLAPSYEANFRNIFARGGDDAASNLLRSIDSEAGLGPCAFDAIAVSYAQFIDIRKAYKLGACLRPE